MRKFAAVGMLTLLVTFAALLSLRPPTVLAQTSAMRGFSYVHLSGAGSTQVTSAPLLLHNVTVNTAGTTLTLYDNASSCATTTIGVIGAVTGTFNYDLQLKNGLCITVAGTADATVTFR